MITNPIVSIIIPNFNNEKYITQCIESVEAQTYSPIEIVIVDDVSTDNSRDIINNLAKRYENITPIYLDKNGGVSNARNIGVNYSNGEYICFLDPDDFFWADDKIENEIRLIKDYLQKGQKIMAFSGVICVNESGEYVEDRGLDGQLTGHIVSAYLARYKEDKHPRNEIVDKAGFYEAGGFNEKMSFWEDSDLFIRLLRIRDIYFTGKFGTAYRYKPSGLSHSDEKAEDILRNLEIKYYYDLIPRDKVHFHYYKVKRCLYEFKRRTIPILLHKGSRIKHNLIGQ